MLWIVCVAGLGMRVAGLWEHFPFIPAVCVRRRPGVPLIPHCSKVSLPALSREQVMINRSSIIEVKDFLHPLLMVLHWWRALSKRGFIKKITPVLFQADLSEPDFSLGISKCILWDLGGQPLVNGLKGCQHQKTRVSRGWMIYSEWLWCISEWLFVI